MNIHEVSMCHLAIQQQLKKAGVGGEVMKTGARAHKNAVGQLRNQLKNKRKWT